MDHALGDYIVDEEADVKYSIVVGDSAPDASSKTFSIFYWGTVPIVRTLHLQTAVSSFVTELEAMVAPQRNDSIYLRAGVVSAGDRIGLVPVSMLVGLGDQNRVAQRAGVSVSAPLVVSLDPVSGAIAPLARSLKGPDPYSRLSSVAAPGAPDRFVLEGERRVDAVFAMTTGPLQPRSPMVEPASRAATLYRTAPWAMNLDAFGPSTFEGLAAMLREARGFKLTQTTPARALFGSISEAMGQRS
jgi:hypothetical protein